MTKSVVIRIAIVVITVIVVVAGRGLFYYGGSYHAPAVETPSYEGIVVPPAPMGGFADNYTQGKGVVLIDLAHDNNFDVEELNVLMLRLISRGLSIKFLATEDDLEKRLLGKEEAKEENGEEAGAEPEEALAKGKEEPEEPLPQSFIVVSPQSAFSKEEKKTLAKFVDEGGKLLLIADPTRSSRMNDLSLEFGLIFEPDYLYNMKENEINYQNIFVTEFKENKLTKGLGKIVFYTAGSISSDNSSIVFVDENTFSSVIETRKRLSPIALARDATVLAIYDLTFISEPHNGVLDNNQLIANIADWLMISTQKVKP